MADDDLRRIADIEARFAKQIEKMGDHVTELNNSVASLSANLGASDKINSVNFKALERLFDRMDKNDEAIDEIRGLQAEQQGGLNVFKWIASLLGIPGILAFLREFFQ